MTWRYELIKRDGMYGVYEVYEDGSRTEDPVDLTGETPEEVVVLIGQVLQDVMEDVLIVGTDEDL